MSACFKEREARAMAREYLGRHSNVLTREGSGKRRREQDAFCRDSFLRSIEAGADFSKLAPDTRAVIVRTLKAEGRSESGPDPDDMSIRDCYICVCVNTLRRIGFPATRRLNRSSTEPSACSIVTDVLHEIGVNLDERSVMEIWRRMLKIWGPEKSNQISPLRARIH
jgi:hypothetical protein